MMTTDNPIPRIFKIGANRIVEDASMAQLTTEQIRSLLQVSYPEVAHATVRERSETVEGREVHLLEFLPQAGRKG